MTVAKIEEVSSRPSIKDTVPGERSPTTQRVMSNLSVVLQGRAWGRDVARYLTEPSGAGRCRTHIHIAPPGPMSYRRIADVLADGCQGEYWR